MITILKGHVLRIIASSLIFCGHITYTYGQYVTNASAGSIIINGDIEPVRDALNYFSFGISCEIKNNFLIEAKLGFGKAFGVNPESASTGAQGGYLVEEEYSVLGERNWYPAYRNNMLMFDASLNYRPEIGINWLRVLGGVGIGVTKSSRSVNLKGTSDNFYIRDFSTLQTDDRIQQIKNYYDVTYETPFNEGSSVSPHLSLQLALQFRLNDYLYLNIEARHHITTTDYLDVVKYQAPNVETGNNDSVTMLSVGFSGYLSRETNTKLVDD